MSVVPERQPRCPECGRITYLYHIKNHTPGEGVPAEEIQILDSEPVPWGQVLLLDSRHAEYLQDHMSDTDAPLYRFHFEVCPAQNQLRP